MPGVATNRCGDPNSRLRETSALAGMRAAKNRLSGEAVSYDADSRKPRLQPWNLTQKATTLPGAAPPRRAKPALRGPRALKMTTCRVPGGTECRNPALIGAPAL